MKKLFLLILSTLLIVGNTLDVHAGKKKKRRSPKHSPIHMQDSLHPKASSADDADIEESSEGEVAVERTASEAVAHESYQDTLQTAQTILEKYSTDPEKIEEIQSTLSQLENLYLQTLNTVNDTTTKIDIIRETDKQGNIENLAIGSAENLLTQANLLNIKAQEEYLNTQSKISLALEEIQAHLDKLENPEEQSEPYLGYYSEEQQNKLIAFIDQIDLIRRMIQTEQYKINTIQISLSELKQAIESNFEIINEFNNSLKEIIKAAIINGQFESNLIGNNAINYIKFKPNELIEEEIDYYLEFANPLNVKSIFDLDRRTTQEVREDWLHHCSDYVMIAAILCGKQYMYWEWQPFEEHYALIPILGIVCEIENIEYDVAKLECFNSKKIIFELSFSLDKTSCLYLSPARGIFKENLASTPLQFQICFHRFFNPLSQDYLIPEERCFLKNKTNFKKRKSTEKFLVGFLSKEQLTPSLTSSRLIDTSSKSSILSSTPDFQLNLSPELRIPFLQSTESIPCFSPLSTPTSSSLGTITPSSSRSSTSSNLVLDELLMHEDGYLESSPPRTSRLYSTKTHKNIKIPQSSTSSKFMLSGEYKIRGEKDENHIDMISCALSLKIDPNTGLLLAHKEDIPFYSLSTRKLTYKPETQKQKTTFEIISLLTHASFHTSDFSESPKNQARLDLIPSITRTPFTGRPATHIERPLPITPQASEKPSLELLPPGVPPASKPKTPTEKK